MCSIPNVKNSDSQRWILAHYPMWYGALQIQKDSMNPSPPASHPLFSPASPGSQICWIELYIKLFYYLHIWNNDSEYSMTKNQSIIFWIDILNLCYVSDTMLYYINVYKNLKTALLHRYESRGWERLNNFSEVTQVLGDRVGNRIQVWSQSAFLDYYTWS
jgi:hypothetical protein